MDEFHLADHESAHELTHLLPGTRSCPATKPSRSPPCTCRSCPRRRTPGRRPRSSCSKRRTLPPRPTPRERRLRSSCTTCWASWSTPPPGLWQAGRQADTHSLVSRKAFDEATTSGEPGSQPGCGAGRWTRRGWCCLHNWDRCVDTQGGRVRAARAHAVLIFFVFGCGGRGHQYSAEREPLHRHSGVGRVSKRCYTVARLSDEIAVHEFMEFFL